MDKKQKLPSHGEIIQYCLNSIASYQDGSEAFTLLRVLYKLEEEINKRNSEFFSKRPLLSGEIQLCSLLVGIENTGALPSGFRQYLDTRRPYLPRPPDEHSL